MKFKKFTALCLCAVLLSSGLLTACKKSEETVATPDEATAVVTQAHTEEESTTSSPATEATTQATTEEVTQQETTSAPATQPAIKAPDKTNSSSSGNSQSAQQSKPITCVITVDGKDHTAELGDTLTYTCYLKTPKKIENVQATLNYPGTTLNLLDTVLVTDLEEIEDSTTADKLNKELEGVFPVLKSSAIYNAYNHNIIKFNASNISGIDFTKGDYLIKLRFEVISGINGAVSTKIEFMDEVGGEPYVDDYKFTKDIEFEEKLTG